MESDPPRAPGEGHGRVPVWLKLAYGVIVLWCIVYLVAKFREHGTDPFTAILSH